MREKDKQTYAEKREYIREWRARNAEKVRAYGRTEKAKATAREWHAANQKRVLEKRRLWEKANPSYQKDWYWHNLEKRREQARASYQRRRLARLAGQAEWARKNRDHVNAKNRERYRDPTTGRGLRMLLRKGDDPVWVLTLKGDPCSYCGVSGGEIDHVVPTVHGGTNGFDNLTASCRKCNASKNDRPLLIFLRERALRVG